MSNQEWDGKGFPPLGSLVEHSVDGYVEISAVLAYCKNSDGVVLEDAEGDVWVRDIDNVWPAQSSAEVTINEMVKDVGGEIYSYVTRETICRAMYYAGYRKTEDFV